MRVLNNRIIVEGHYEGVQDYAGEIFLIDPVDCGYEVGVIYAGDEKAMKDNGLAVGDKIYYSMGGGIEEFEYDDKDLIVMHVGAIIGRKEDVDG